MRKHIFALFLLVSAPIYADETETCDDLVRRDSLAIAKHHRAGAPVERLHIAAEMYAAGAGLPAAPIHAFIKAVAAADREAGEAARARWMAACNARFADERLEN